MINRRTSTSAKIVPLYDLVFSRGHIPAGTDCEIIDVEKRDDGMGLMRKHYCVYTENYNYEGCFAVYGEDDSCGSEWLTFREIHDWFADKAVLAKQLQQNGEVEFRNFSVFIGRMMDKFNISEDDMPEGGIKEDKYYLWTDGYQVFEYDTPTEAAEHIVSLIIEMNSIKV